jgi:hypothetical protein
MVPRKEYPFEQCPFIEWNILSRGKGIPLYQNMYGANICIVSSTKGKNSNIIRSFLLVDQRKGLDR